MKLIILIGISCSGKSTYCKSLKNSIIISKDLEREKYFKTNINNYFERFNLKETEPLFNNHFNNLIKKIIKNEINSDKDIIIDSRGNMSFINFILDNFYGLNIIFKYFDISLEEAKNRALFRIQKSGNLDKQLTLYNNVKNYIKESYKYPPTYNLDEKNLTGKLIVITDINTLKRIKLESSDIIIITTTQLHNYLEKQYPHLKVINFNKSKENKHFFIDNILNWIVVNNIGKERYADDIHLSSKFKIV